MSLPLQSRAEPGQARGSARTGLGLLGGALAATTLWLAAAQGGAIASPLDEAQVLMDARQPAAALRLLDPLERDRAGDIRYDYLLAVAALDSGRPARAVAVFDRILASAPHLAGIRLELAKALGQTGDLHRARGEIAAVLVAPDLPPELKAAARDLGASLRARQLAQLTDADAASASASLADEDASVATPPISLSVNALASPPGTRLNAVIADGVTVQGALHGGYDSLRWHANAGATSLIQGDRSIQSYDSRAGLGIEHGALQLGAGLHIGRFVQEGRHVNDTLGLSADWLHQLSPSIQLALTASLSRQLNAGSGASGQDTEVRGLTAAWSFTEPSQRTLLTVQLGADRQTMPGGSQQRGVDRAELSTRWQSRLGEQLDMAAHLSVQRLAPRNAEAVGMSPTTVTMEAGIGLDWRWAKAWSLRPTLTWSSANGLASFQASSQVEMSMLLRGRF